jgi:UDP-N-acetylmuramyl pentapeptide phosphotransferase/UDP-N-acetylglucosamine-1-phosphate transferase
VNTVVVAFLISLAVALLLTPLVREAAIRLGALDRALSSRKAHGRPESRFGCIAIVVVATFFWVAFANHRLLMTLFMVCLAGGLLGFLLYTFHPASIFMGDSGSLLVGFVLAATALETHEKSTTAGRSSCSSWRWGCRLATRCPP